jgi:uncharacterized Zn-binding protein involved in type VI secretion
VVGKWSGIIHRVGAQSAAEKGHHDEFEKPDDWNHLECICDGASITVQVNGKPVIACTDVSIHRGKIVLLTEGDGILFRKVTVTPLKK